MKIKDVDICITTYKKNESVFKILEVLSKQTNMNFNLIINDDGSSELLNPTKYSIITKYIWNEDDGYNRVGRFNESVSLCVSPNIILLDDDCIPANVNFIQSHLSSLAGFDVSKGLIRFPDGSFASGWFSTANLGIKLKLIKEIGLFDKCYNGHYGYEDLDFGNQLKKNNIKVCDSGEETIVDHDFNQYKDGDRTDAIIGHNQKEFERKWGK